MISKMVELKYKIFNFEISQEGMYEKVWIKNLKKLDNGKEMTNLCIKGVVYLK